MTQKEKAEHFASLHKKGEPVVLYNVWDAGSAKAIADAGASAIATGSWSVAAAHGYADGEEIPIDLLFTIASRMAASVSLPVTIDFEGGYAEAPDELQHNISRLIETGAVGLNFEDQRVNGEGIYAANVQQDRIRAIRVAGDSAGIPLVINARTDLFLKEADAAKHADLVTEAKERGAAYAEAGASCFFIPGLTDLDLIADICNSVSLPVNAMTMNGNPALADLTSAGVSRISFGPFPYRTAISNLAEEFKRKTA